VSLSLPPSLRRFNFPPFLHFFQTTPYKNPPLSSLSPSTGKKLTMVSKFKVAELRSQLRLRGLDETGTKPVLVNPLSLSLSLSLRKFLLSPSKNCLSVAG